MITIDHLVCIITVCILPTCLHLRSANFDLHFTPYSRTSILCASIVTFLPIALKSIINVKFEYIFKKPMKCRFQRYTVCMEILSTFHARVEYICVTKYAIETTGPLRANNPQNPPLLLEAHGPPSLDGGQGPCASRGRAG